MKLVPLESMVYIDSLIPTYRADLEDDFSSLSVNERESAAEQVLFWCLLQMWYLEDLNNCLDGLKFGILFPRYWDNFKKNWTDKGNFNVGPQKVIPQGFKYYRNYMVSKLNGRAKFNNRFISYSARLSKSCARRDKSLAKAESQRNERLGNVIKEDTKRNKDKNKDKSKDSSKEKDKKKEKKREKDKSKDSTSSSKDKDKDNSKDSSSSKDKEKDKNKDSASSKDKEKDKSKDSTSSSRDKEKDKNKDSTSSKDKEKDKSKDNTSSSSSNNSTRNRHGSSNSNKSSKHKSRGNSKHKSSNSSSGINTIKTAPLALKPVCTQEQISKQQKKHGTKSNNKRPSSVTLAHELSKVCFFIIFCVIFVYI